MKIWLSFQKWRLPNLYIFIHLNYSKTIWLLGSQYKFDTKHGERHRQWIDYKPIEKREKGVESWSSFWFCCQTYDQSRWNPKSFKMGLLNSWTQRLPMVWWSLPPCHGFHPRLPSQTSQMRLQSRPASPQHLPLRNRMSIHPQRRRRLETQPHC